MITDPRIGRRGPKGRVVQVPNQYVTGEHYNAAANPAPTIFWIDEDGEYFVILPVSMSRINPETHAFLLKSVDKGDQINFTYNSRPDEPDPTLFPPDDDEEEEPIKLDKNSDVALLRALVDKTNPKKTVKVVPTTQRPAKPSMASQAQAQISKPKPVIEKDEDEDDDEEDAYVPPTNTVQRSAKSLGLAQAPSASARPKPLRPNPQNVALRVDMPKPDQAISNIDTVSAPQILDKVESVSTKKEVAEVSEKQETTGKTPKKSNVDK